jgi:hypothetical protein
MLQRVIRMLQVQLSSLSAWCGANTPRNTPTHVSLDGVTGDFSAVGVLQSQPLLVVIDSDKVNECPNAMNFGLHACRGGFGWSGVALLRAGSGFGRCTYYYMGKRCRQAVGFWERPGRTNRPLPSALRNVPN